MNGDTPMDARVSVLESDTRRIEERVNELDGRMRVVESCASGIPRIEKNVEDVLSQLKYLNECKIANEAVARAKVPFMESVWGQRLWDIGKMIAIALITWVVTVNQFIAGK
ncbi:hypothetical protein M0R72_08550 [Candidatus Pacearchaeota archaeon]|jgi:hypothetical protein|nr:hypothetical protein [Candidatus Pacearchaeota archaeon]